MLGYGKALHAFADGGLDYGFERVFCVAGTELSGVAVHREGHIDLGFVSLVTIRRL